MADALIFSSSVSPSPEDDASALERSASPSVSQGTDSISDCISYQSQDEVMSRDNFLISDDGESIDSGTAQEIRISLQEIDDDRHCAMGYKPALRWALMGAVGMLCCAAVYALWEFEVIEWVLVWLEGIGPIAGFAVFVPAFFFVSLPIGWGYVVLNLGAGYLWGLWIGQVVVASSAAVGTFLATHVLRWAGVSWIEEQVSTNPQMASLLAVLNGPQAFKVIILTRLTPIPYGLQNAVFSMVHISMSSYMFATVVGLFPTQLLNTYFGTTLHSVEDVLRGGRLDTATAAVFAGQLSVGIVLMAGIGYAARREFNRHAREQDLELQGLAADGEES